MTQNRIKKNKKKNVEKNKVLKTKESGLYVIKNEISDEILTSKCLFGEIEKNGKIMN